MFKNEEGFSLLELVVAVGVAGIIAAVALPTFAGLQDKATTTSATYAASASAAEALANSTMGLTGSTGSASSSTTSGPVSLGITWAAVSTNDGGGNLGGSGSCNVFNWNVVNTIRMYCTPPQSTFDTLASLTPGHPMAVTSENNGNTYNVTFVSWDPATKTINVSGLDAAPNNQIFNVLSF